jgi:hypothetical protein
MVFAGRALWSLLGGDEVLVGGFSRRSRGMVLVGHVAVVDRASEQWWRWNGQREVVRVFREHQGGLSCGHFWID